MPKDLAYVALSCGPAAMPTRSSKAAGGDAGIGQAGSAFAIQTNGQGGQKP